MYGTALSQRLVDISHNGEHLCNGKVREWRDGSGDLSAMRNRITHKLGESTEVGSFRLLRRVICFPCTLNHYPISTLYPFDQNPIKGISKTGERAIYCFPSLNRFLHENHATELHVTQLIYINMYNSAFPIIHCPRASTNHTQIRSDPSQIFVHHLHLCGGDHRASMSFQGRKG